MYRNNNCFFLSFMCMFLFSAASFCGEEPTPEVRAQVYKVFLDHKDQGEFLMRSIAQALYKQNSSITRRKMLEALGHEPKKAAIFPLEMIHRLWYHFENFRLNDLRTSIKKFSCMRSLPAPDVEIDPLPSQALDVPLWSPANVLTQSMSLLGLGAPLRSPALEDDRDAQNTDFSLML